MNSTPLFLTDVIAGRRVLLTSDLFCVELQFSEVGLQQALYISMRSCHIDFNQDDHVANSENHLGRTWPTGIFSGHLNPNSHVKKKKLNLC